MPPDDLTQGEGVVQEEPSEKVTQSKEMTEYFERLHEMNAECYRIAEAARSQGRDPEDFVEIPQADDLASRVEKLLYEYNVEGIAEDIRRLSQEYPNREEVALMIAKDVARKSTGNKEVAVDRAVRAGLAVLTEGILVAPLEGIASTKIMTNADGTDYIDLLFAGPIRAAGGTGQAMSVLIADMVRQEMGIGKYIPTEEEIARFDEEIPLYKQIQHLQFSPSPEEIDLIVRNCPICIDGEGTETVEISGYRDLPRIETNKVRGGACLVIAEGLCQKASKIKKHVDKLGIEGWDFIGKYLDWHKADSEDKAAVNTVQPSDKYLKDLVAGRPIFGYPCKVGGFRLRYGRARTSGLASLAYSPASMYATDEFMALGTQIKIERPGKACVVTPCDMLDGPTLLLKNGNLVYCKTKEEVVSIQSQIEEIIDCGEVLVPFGEFCENNSTLVPPGYCMEWHREEISSRGDLPDDWEDPTYERAKEMCQELDVALHPKFNLFWTDMALPMLRSLREWILANGSYDGALTLPMEAIQKRTLVELCATHKASKGNIVIDEVYSLPLIECLGLRVIDGRISPYNELDDLDVAESISKAAGFKVMGKGGTRIGTRMGRPEKAKEREMSPKTHCLFPMGRDSKGAKDIYSLINASKNKSMFVDSGPLPMVKLDVGMRKCPRCNAFGVMSYCRECMCHTRRIESSGGFNNLVDVNVSLEYENALKTLKETDKWGSMKCPEVLTSKNKTPEAIEKGILRMKNDVTMFKDGTIRYDMTDIPLTHFKPKEIGLTVERAKSLGYVKDWNGEELVDDSQICELKVQDIIPSVDCGTFMIKVAAFLDEELETLYGLKRYYNASCKEDLIGHLTFGLAPHTSGCILSRIIGYAEIQGCYGHPFFHAAKRRNCDGDEDCIILSLDGLLNFSRSFLPNRRGGLMDAPLVLTTKLNPNEIDKEAHNIDCLRRYPLELYHAAMELRDPKTLEKIMDLVGGRIGTPDQYEGLGFTHDTNNISEGPKKSRYVTLGSMLEKLQAQLAIGKKIRAVDERDVANKVINKHFLPDMAGNLRSFSTQTVRCTKCNEKYRRIPLSGVCKCKNQLNLTVHEASVKKYLEASKNLCKDYDMDDYIRERITILEMNIESVFTNEKVKKCTLMDFY